jgi:hypothetical protein
MPFRPILVAGLALAATLAGCIGLEGRGAPPPLPSRDLSPKVIGVIAEVAAGTADGVVVLVSGQRLTLAPQLHVAGATQPARGSLILAGPGDPTAWWTSLQSSTYPRRTAASGQAFGRSPGTADRCWDIYGGAFDEGASIHFSSGLRLPKASDFRIVEDYLPDPFPARAGDAFCVDATGAVAIFVSIFQER